MVVCTVYVLALVFSPFFVSVQAFSFLVLVIHGVAELVPIASVYQRAKVSPVHAAPGDFASLLAYVKAFFLFAVAGRVRWLCKSWTAMSALFGFFTPESSRGPPAISPRFQGAIPRCMPAHLKNIPVREEFVRAKRDMPPLSSLLLL